MSTRVMVICSMYDYGSGKTPFPVVGTFEEDNQHEMKLTKVLMR